MDSRVVGLPGNRLFVWLATPDVRLFLSTGVKWKGNQKKFPFPSHRLRILSLLNRHEGEVCVFEIVESWREKSCGVRGERF